MYWNSLNSLLFFSYLGIFSNIRQENTNFVSSHVQWRIHSNSYIKCACVLLYIVSILIWDVKIDVFDACALRSDNPLNKKLIYSKHFSRTFATLWNMLNWVKWWRHYHIMSASSYYWNDSGAEGWYFESSPQ